MKEISWNEKLWREIPEHKGYYASQDGEILSTRKQEPFVMRQIDNCGYLRVYAYINTKMKRLPVHRAVLMAWDRMPQPGEEARHLNDNSKDNRLENLAWGTRDDNAKDRKRNNGYPQGEKAESHKLTETEVKEIRQRYGKESLRGLAKRYGVSHTAIRRAAKGITWREAGK